MQGSQPRIASSDRRPRRDGRLVGGEREGQDRNRKKIQERQEEESL